MQRIIQRSLVHWTAGAKGGAPVVSIERAVPACAPFAGVLPRRRGADTTAAELIATAHAGSFSLALAQELGPAALSAGDILTSAAVTLERLVAGWTIIGIHLDVVARLPKVKQGRFIDATIWAKTNCLVSRVLRATVSMNAKLER